MNQEDLTYQGIDEMIRNGANEIPVSYNPDGWKKLATELDKVPKPARTKFNFFKFTSLNIVFIIMGLTAVLFAFLLPQKTNSDMAPFNNATVTPLEGKALEKPISLIKEKAENTTELESETSQINVISTVEVGTIDSLIAPTITPPSSAEKDTSNLFIFW